VDNKIGFVLTADDNYLMAQVQQSGVRAGQKLGFALSTTAVGEAEKGFKNSRLDRSLAVMGDGVVAAFAMKAKGLGQVIKDATSGLFGDAVSAAPLVSRKSRVKQNLGAGGEDAGDRVSYVQADTVTPDSLLRSNQADELVKLKASYQRLMMKNKSSSYRSGSVERINIDEQLEVEDLRSKHSEKVAVLRTQLGQYIKERTQKIRQGVQRGGVDYTAAIGRTRDLIVQEQKILNAELVGSSQKYQQQRLVGTRETNKATIADRERLREGRSNEAITRLSNRDVAPGSLQGREVVYRVEMARINEAYDKSRSAGQAQLLDLQQKQSDKVRSGQTSGVDYAAAIGRQQELMRLQEQSRTAELQGLQSKRRWELRQQQEARVEQRTQSVRGIDRAEGQSQQNIVQSRSQVDEISTSDSRSRRKIAYDARISQVNFKHDNTLKDFRDQIRDLEVKRKHKVDSNTNDGVDYTAEIEAKRKLIVENEVLRQSELKFLKIKQQQQEVVFAREAEDRRISATRSRRDGNEQAANQKRLVELQRRKSTTKDPIAGVAIDKEIGDFSLDVDRKGEATKYVDKLADLRLQQRRQEENKRLGISDPVLEVVDFGKEIGAVQGQAAATAGKFKQEQVNSDASFTKTVNQKFKEERQRLVDEAHSLRVESLKIQLTDTKSERLKVGIQLQLDVTEVTKQYDDALRKLDDLLADMQDRRDRFINLKLPVEPIDAMIKSIEQLQKDTGIQKTGALKSIETRTPFQVATAAAVEQRKEVNAISLTKTPQVALLQAQSQGYLDRGRLAGNNEKAAVYGRSAAIGTEQLRYNDQRASLKEQVAQAQASGIVFPTDELDRMSAAVDKVHEINLGNIKAQFDELNASVSTSNQKLLDLGNGAATDFFQQMIGGTASVDDAFKGMLRSIVQGLSQIVAQNLAGQIFGSADTKDKYQGNGSNIISTIGKFLGFADGGEVPHDNSFKTMRQGNNPVAVALRKEGVNAVMAALTPGERVLNLRETAAYHARFPQGILNYATGGIAGGQANMGASMMAAGSAIGGGNLGGDFNFKFEHEGQGKPEQGGLDRFEQRLKGSMREIIVDEMRSGGALNRFR
jgi:hypothetical protein